MTGAGLTAHILTGLKKSLTTNEPCITKESFALNTTAALIKLCLPHQQSLIIGTDEEAQKLAGSLTQLIPIGMNDQLDKALNVIDSTFATYTAPLTEAQGQTTGSDHPLHQSQMPFTISLKQPLPNFIKNILLALKKDVSEATIPPNSSYISKAKFYAVKSIKLCGYSLMTKTIPPLLRWKAHDNSTILERIQRIAHQINRHKFDILHQAIDTFAPTAIQQ